MLHTGNGRLTVIRRLVSKEDYDQVMSISNGPEPQLAEGQALTGIVADRDGTIVGYLEVRIVPVLEALINPNRSSRVAADLLKTALFCAHNNNFPDVLAAIPSEREPLGRLLKRLGWEEVRDYSIFRFRFSQKGGTDE